MELQLTTRRWTIRIARTKPAPTPVPSNAPYPMRVGYNQPTPRRATKDVR